MGQTLLAQGQLAEAVDELRAAADRMPHDLMVQTELGWALWEVSDLWCSGCLTGVLAIDGGNPGALRARGEILADLGDARNACATSTVRCSTTGPSGHARGLARAELGDQDCQQGGDRGGAR